MRGAEGALHAGNPPHDALYTALGLGPRVTVVGSRSGLRQAWLRWREAAAAPRDPVPAVWADVVRTLLEAGRAEEKKGRRHGPSEGAEEDCNNKRQTDTPQ